MGFKVGDSYFSRDGYAGVILARDPKTAALEVERDGPNIEKTRNIGYINGLSQTERGEFESIITQMRERKDPRERVQWLHGTLEQLREDPKKQVLTRYLEGELAHIMNSEGIFPRVFTVDATKI